MTKKRLKRKDFNLVFAIFFSTLFLSYENLRGIGYLFYLIAILVLVLDLFKCKKNKYNILLKTNIFYLFLFFCIHSIISSIINIFTGNSDVGSLIKLLSSYIIFLFLYFKIKIYGNRYIQNFYRLFMIVSNFFVIINIYEIITKTSMFSKFLTTDLKDFQAVFYGTQYFRTSSIFMHPIVYGLFLIVLFWCNEYLITNKYKYLLQINIIINIYFTKSRSAWLAFACVFLLYYVKKIFNKIKNKKFKLTTKSLAIIPFIMVAIITFSIIFREHIHGVIYNITNRFISITDDSYGDGSRIQRLGAIEVIYEGMKEKGPLIFVFGNGINSSREFMENNTVLISGFSSADNQYATFFYEFGFIGLSIFIVINIFAALEFIKSKSMYNIRNLSILVLLSISIDIFFFDGFRWTSIAILLVTVITFLCITSKDDSEELI